LPSPRTATKHIEEGSIDSRDLNLKKNGNRWIGKISALAGSTEICADNFEAAPGPLAPKARSRMLKIPPPVLVLGANSCMRSRRIRSAVARRL
jgi:hypothetical protein